MKQVLLFSILVMSLSACSTARLKRCDSKPDDPKLYTCKERAEGIYLWCEKPKNLYSCEDLP